MTDSHHSITEAYLDVSPFKVIAILGATGSFGRAMTRFLLDHTNATLRLMSRSELPQVQMEQELAPYASRLRFMLGDIRDLARLNVALYGVDLVISAAALKQVPKGEYDPEEYVKTNINGTQNIIHACHTMQVKRALFLSTDKALFSVNLYGHTKAVSEQLWVRGNGYAPQGTEFIVTRWGNITGSSGSVLEHWKKQLRARQTLSVTDPRMSRFYANLPDAVRMAWFAAHYPPRGSVLVPHLPAYRVPCLAEAVIQEYATGESVAIEQVGKRPGERLAETLATDEELETALTYTQDGTTPPGQSPGQARYYAIPPVAPSWAMPPVEAWPTPPGGAWQRLLVETPYRSDVWSWRLGVEELRARLREVA